MEVEGGGGGGARAHATVSSDLYSGSVLFISVIFTSHILCVFTSCFYKFTGFDYKTCNVLLAVEEPTYSDISSSHFYHVADSVEDDNDPAGDQV